MCLNYRLPCFDKLNVYSLYNLNRVQRHCKLKKKTVPLGGRGKLPVGTKIVTDSSICIIPVILHILVARLRTKHVAVLTIG